MKSLFSSKFHVYIYMKLLFSSKFHVHIYMKLNISSKFHVYIYMKLLFLLNFRHIYTRNRIFHDKFMVKFMIKLKVNYTSKFAEKNAFFDFLPVCCFLSKCESVFDVWLGDLS